MGLGGEVDSYELISYELVSEGERLVTLGEV